MEEMQQDHMTQMAILEKEKKALEDDLERLSVQKLTKVIGR